MKNIKKVKENDKDFNKKIKLLEEFIDKNKALHDIKGTLMGVLHKTQDIFGYLPKEIMNLISERLSIPIAHIYGMATFYNYFSIKPRGVYKIYVCKGTACYVGGGARLLERLKELLKINEGDITEDGLFGLNITRCFGCCGLSPVMQVNEDIYVRMIPEKISKILAKYKK